MSLTGRQIRQLRKIGHHLDPVVIIGKANVGAGTVAQASESLEAHELIKCSVLDTSALTARAAADEVAKSCGAEIVQVIGRRFTLYRRSSRDDIEHIDIS
ncbi:protein of unknown function UPF0044 [Coriobacterium glomerans PW2]|uniref:CRM domain-containing protein n=2 Tax=Coriobacterium TaxID=33870 RepID=F2NAR6_CORGP|nr:protein of unknown function UPF0044 [Coriobacterium glomerans PW2]